jgi:uncharacterized protein
MHVPIKIRAGNVILNGKRFDSSCASAVVGSLPLDGEANRWGDEFYFGVPLKYTIDETATTSVKIGDIGFWPPGRPSPSFLARHRSAQGPTPRLPAA